MTPPATKSRKSWLMLLKNDETRNCQDIKFTTDYPKTTFATLQTTNMLINNSSVPDNNKIMAQQVDTIAMLPFVLLKYPSVASTFLGMTWQNNCEMPRRRAKSVILLHPHLNPGPIKGNSTVQTNMTATIKALKKIFYGKTTMGPTEGKNYQTTRKSNGTTSSNK